MKNAPALVLICKLRSKGCSWNEIADTLNDANLRTTSGKEFWANTVKQLHEQHCSSLKAA